MHGKQVWKNILCSGQWQPGRQRQNCMNSGFMLMKQQESSEHHHDPKHYSIPEHGVEANIDNSFTNGARISIT